MQPYDNLHTTTYCHYGTDYRKATHIWTNSAMRAPLRNCSKADPCGHVQLSGKHPVVAQAGPSKNGTPCMGSGENFYAIPLDLTRSCCGNHCKAGARRMWAPPAW